MALYGRPKALELMSTLNNGLNWFSITYHIFSQYLDGVVAVSDVCPSDKYSAIREKLKRWGVVFH